MRSIRFTLSPLERELVLKQGYPFEDFEASLKACEDDPEPVEFVLGQYWFEHLLGEIARSANHTSSKALEGRLSDLYEYLEEVAGEHGLATY